MPAVTIAEMLAIEASAQAKGWTEDQLLTTAGERLGIAIGRFFPGPRTTIAYLGKGHNAGDALVALRVLRDQLGWKVFLRCAWPITEFAPLTLKKWNECGNPMPLEHAPSWRDLDGPLVLLDGLLGSGACGSLRSPIVELAKEMAGLRLHAGARVAAIDLPSGIDADSGEISPDTVRADVTFMIGSAKCGLLQARAAAATGALSLVPVDPLASDAPADLALISPQTMECGKEKRPFDCHKGMAGRVAILAGSECYSGAAVLAATGALRGGAGLITLFVPNTIRCLVSSKCPPEIIVRGINSPRELLDFKFDALVVGCGLGEMEPTMAEDLLGLIDQSLAPAVIDADALNQMARSQRLDLLSERHVVTPHPGEFMRLTPDLATLPREEAARHFSDRFPTTLVLKGSRTIVTRRGEPLWINSTGTPAMASGGQGDLLAGVIGARLAFGDPTFEAAALACWVCGRAAEIALDQEKHSEESLTASDVGQFLGAAFRDWKNSHR
jgi:ADP-dependent NAD(P)H-hydrate dehydratase / NAD(P)H-hydrate epimerase